jgi:UDP-N-acetylglucosamine 2-epimerase (non-hydrolysing)
MKTEPLKIMLIAGARPNFMKVAPIIKATQAYNLNCGDGGVRIKCKLVHTGQHYDQKMSQIFFDELGIPEPDINLGVGSGSHAVQTATVMVQFEQACESEKPDWVIVVGDVNSTIACTLVCAKMGIKVAHVEAGLRSFDRTMPEEVNRIVTDALADLLLTPSEDGNQNLHREGVPECKIKLVGNVMVDSLVTNLEESRKSPILKQLGLEPKNFAYVTLHRPSNVDERSSLEAIMSELKRLSAQMPVVLPMHPRTRKMCGQFGIALNGKDALKVIEPIGYHESLSLTENARVILTDSGGLQEESTYFRTPCLTLRANTERPVTITIGSNKLTSILRLRDDFEQVLEQPERIGAIPPLWDGRAAERIVRVLAASAGILADETAAKADINPSALAAAS